MILELLSSIYFILEITHIQLVKLRTQSLGYYLWEFLFYWLIFAFIFYGQKYLNQDEVNV